MSDRTRKKASDKYREREILEHRSDQTLKLFQEAGLRRAIRESGTPGKMRRLSELPADFPDRTRLMLEERDMLNPRRDEKGRLVDEGAAMVKNHCLFLKSRESNSVGWIPLDEIKEGYHSTNDNWVTRKGNTLETYPKLPEGEEAITRDWRRRNPGPLIDNLTLKENKPPAEQLAREQKVNKLFNQGVEASLKKQLSLSEALKIEQEKSEGRLAKAVMTIYHI